LICESLMQATKEELGKTTGLITDIERYAINDGFGLRTTVFVKGCPLRCAWCSNPETQENHQEMFFFQDKCIGCGECIHTCGRNAVSETLVADRTVCADCYKSGVPFSCVENCYAQCRKIAGDRTAASEVMQVVKRDQPFYELSGGGVTVSGGEPMMQPEFTYAVLKLLTLNYIHTAIETCGAGQADDYKKIAPYLNLAFLDLKHTDDEKHTEYTGTGNVPLLENIILMDRLSGEHGFELMLRVPVIPGFNDTKEEMDCIAGFIRQNCKNAKGVELLPYHKLGRGKYASLGRVYEFAGVQPPSDTRMADFIDIFHQKGIQNYRF
jgi:pyruvate formate lyase activating enzyme